MKGQRPRRERSRDGPEPEIVRLQDLAPPANPRGGARKRVFGEEPRRLQTRKPGRD